MAKRTKDMDTIELRDFNVEHSDLSFEEVMTIIYLSDETVMEQIVREMRRGWMPAVEEPKDELIIDGIVIRLSKDGKTKML